MKFTIKHTRQQHGKDEITPGSIESDLGSIHTIWVDDSHFVLVSEIQSVSRKNIESDPGILLHMKNKEVYTMNCPHDLSEALLQKIEDMMVELLSPPIESIS